VRPRHAARVEHREHRQRAGHDHRGTAAGRLRLEQGGDHRPHRDLAQQWTGRKGSASTPGARVSSRRDDRGVPRGVPGQDALARAVRPPRRPGGAHGCARLPRERRGVLHHRRVLPVDGGLLTT
jgi:hypothetical protein